MVIQCLVAQTKIIKRADTSSEVSALNLSHQKSFTGQQYIKVLAEFRAMEIGCLVRNTRKYIRAIVGGRRLPLRVTLSE